ncbi:MAG: sodium:solute symporter [Burkholderiaceae bacterium]
MHTELLFGFAFWGFLVAYGVAMYAVSPQARTVSAFFAGTDEQGRAAGEWALMLSIFISWIFAKSITNAANLGAAHGVVGGLAYATYWLSIPLAGVVIYRLRTRYAATGLVQFLTSKYGRLAALAFSAAILIRLYNEVWSNTAVVGGYYGAPGTPAFIGAALLFTAATLFYSLKGGLRSSIFTDVIQAALFVVFAAFALLVVLPRHGVGNLIAVGEFTLAGGVDLILVAALQALSYPFHDPVLTDRGFITRERAMLRAFVVAGALGFVCIFGFSLVGVHARLEGIASGDNVPAAVAGALGLGALFLMSVVMISAAGSTLDSTFSSVAKSVGRELPLLAGRTLDAPRAIRIGMLAMIAIAVVGNLPMVAGTDILKATTVSGTMVMGLAPVFLLHRWADRSPWSFHLSFWTGIAIGLLLAAGALPQSWAIGGGKYALLLGANAYGLALCTAGFLLPIALRRLAAAGRSVRSASR